MSKPPAFQFYARDWVSDERVRTMSWEAKGVYIDMLAHQWLEGSLPDFGPTLARLLGLDSRRLARIRVELSANFSAPDEDGRIRNEKLEAQRKQDLEWREGQSDHGKKGAEKRWGSHGYPNGVAIKNAWGKDSSAPASAPALKEPTVENPEWPPWVEPILDDWISVHGLPTRTKPEKCRKVFYDLQHLDHNDPDEIARVCAWIVRNKVPTYIKSPMKLRKPNGDDDCQTFEMYAEMSLNGSPKASTDGRDYLRETAQ